MNRRLEFLSFATLLAVLGGAASAHHSFPGAYDVSEQRVMQGVATDFLFRNPHAFIVIEIAGDDGMEQWHLELPPRWALERRGFTDTTIRAGDELLVTCNPARDGGRSCGVGQRGGFYRETDGYLYGRDPRTDAQ
jgi:hypothetical protein